MLATLRAINVGLSLLAPLVPERSSSPALTAVMIEPRPGALLLSGGWDVSAVVRVPVETAPGDAAPALIGAHLLRELLRVAPGDLVELRTVAPSLGDKGHTVPGRLDFRAGSFEVTLESGDVDRAPVPLDSDDFAGLVFGAPVDLAAVRAALGVAPKSSYSAWDTYAFLTGGAVGTSDGVKIGRADLDVPGVSAPVAVPAASLLTALKGAQGDAVVRVARIGDGSGLVVRVEHCGVWMLARVPVRESIAAPESLLLTLAGEVGPVLAQLPPLDPSSNPARKLDKRGNLTAARPWTAAQIKAAVRGVGVLGLLPCGTYEGVTLDGGSVQALPGAGEGVPGHVVVMHGARLVELGTAGGTLHTPAAFGGRHVFRADGGTVGALGHTVLNVSRPGLVTLDEWGEIRRELRGAYWAGRASDLHSLLVNLDWSFGAFSEASRIIAEYADLHAAARADGHTLQAGPDWARGIVRGVVESRRAAREQSRGVLGRTWGAAVKAAGGVRDWEARTVPEIGKNSKPKRVPVALTRALTEARGAFTRAAVAVTEAGLEYLSTMTAHGAALGAAALLFPESFRPGRVLGAPLDADDIMTRAAAVYDRRAAARAARAARRAGAVEPETVPAPVAAPEVEPAPSPAPAALRDEPAYVQAAGLIAAARPDLRAARAAGAGAGVVPGMRARVALLDAASHLRGTLDAFTPGALTDRAERIAAGWERAADVLPCLHGARWTLARLVAGKHGGRVRLLPGVNGAAGLDAPRDAYHLARVHLLTLAGVQARRAAVAPLFPTPTPAALNGAAPVAVYHLARVYLLVLAGVQARRAAVVPFPVLQAPAPEVEPAPAPDPAAVLGALEALALVPGGDLVELGARVAAGDPAAVQAGAAAAVILAALRAPWRARGADMPGVLVVAGGPGIEPPPTPGGPGGAGRGSAAGGASVEHAPTPATAPDTAPGGPVGTLDTAPDTAPGGPVVTVLGVTFSPADVPRDLATDAHRWTSFTPERRAEQEQQSYFSHVTAFAALVEANAGDRATLAGELLAGYKAGYLQRLQVKLGRDSRTASTMITGGSKFPTARNQKRLDAAHNALTELLTWSERRRARILRVLREGPQQNAAQRADGTAAALAKREQEQEHMKAVNKACRAKDPHAALAALGITGALAEKFLKPDWSGQKGYPDYKLKNNGAEIRRLRAKLAERVQVAQVAAVEAVGVSDVHGVQVEEDRDADRLRLVFPGKPSERMRGVLKGRGFRWAPSVGAWQRQLTPAAREAARAVLEAFKDEPEAGGADVVPGHGVEVAVVGSRGVVSAVVRDDCTLTITAAGAQYHGTYDARGAVFCPGEWVEVAGARALELRGQIAEKARREGWAQ